MSATPFEIDHVDLLQHDRWLRAVARALVRGADVDDVVQDTWTAAFAQRPDADRSLRAWLGTVAQRLATRARRAETRRHARELAAARHDEVPSTATTVAVLELQRRVSAAVTALPEPYRSAILLRYFHGLSHAEIAARDGLSEPTIRKRTQRGLDLLRGQLTKHDPDWQRSPAMAALLAPALPPIGAALIGGLIMSHGAKVSAAALLLVTLGGTGWWMLAARPAAPTVATAPAAASLAAATDHRRTAIEAEAAPSREEVADPASNASAPPPTVAPERSVGGRVVGVDGLPLGGVPLALVERLPGRGEPPLDMAALDVLAHSDADGRFTIHASGYGNLVAGPGWTTLCSPPLGWVSDGALVVAARAVTVAGQVVDGDGKPLAAAQVEAGRPVLGAMPLSLDRTTRAAPPATETAADGSFTLAGLAASTGAITFRLDGYMPVVVEVPAVDTLGQRIVLQQAPGTPRTVTGTVLDPFGAPLPDALVGAREVTARSDAHGRFRLDLPAANPAAPHDAMLFAAHAGYQTLLLPDALAHGNAAPLDVELRLQGPALTISGHVVDPAGEPVAGALVYLWGPENVTTDRTAEELAMPADAPLRQIGPGTRVFATTGHDGAFTIRGLRQADYRLHVLLKQPRAGFTSEPIAAGSTGVELRAPERLTYEHLAGQVVDRDGKPMPGVFISPSLAIYRVSDQGIWGDGLRGTSTDAEGRWELHDIPRDDLTLSYTSDAIVPGQTGVDASRDLLDQHLVVVRRNHLRIEASPSAGATSFRVLGGDGNTLPIMELSPGGMLFRNDWPLQNGRSGVLAVSEDAATVVLQGEQGELARLPLVWRPGEVAVVRY